MIPAIPPQPNALRKHTLVIAISSRALFDFEDENQIFESQNDEAYMALQMERLHTPASPGVAFPLVEKLLRFNQKSRHDADFQTQQRVEVVVLSRNDPVSGLRVMRSVTAHGLHDIKRAVFTKGAPAFAYLEPLGAHLFLSANDQDVRSALDAGFAAAKVFSQSASALDRHPSTLRIAFDGDAVLFSDEAERVYQTHGLAAFEQHELTHASKPLPAGPLKPFFESLHQLQQFAHRHLDFPMKIRTALVTARSAPAHERAIRTLMHWGIVVDEAYFLGGLDKGPFLEKFQPDFFFDDQLKHCESSIRAAPTGQVIAGVTNEYEDEDAPLNPAHDHANTDHEENDPPE